MTTLNFRRRAAALLALLFWPIGLALYVLCAGTLIVIIDWPHTRAGFMFIWQQAFGRGRL